MKNIRNATLISSVGVGTIVLCGGLCLSSVIVYIFFGVDRVPIAIDMANNTNETIVVIIEDMSCTARRGELVELPWFKNANGHIRVQKESGLVWDFYWPFSLPRTHLIHYHYYVQLEKNAALYVLPYRIHAPVKTLPPQPPGYPLPGRIQKKE